MSFLDILWMRSIYEEELFVSTIPDSYMWLQLQGMLH